MINFVVFYLYFLSTTRFIQHSAPISLAQDMEGKRITQANKKKKKKKPNNLYITNSNISNVCLPF